MVKQPFRTLPSPPAPAACHALSINKYLSLRSGPSWTGNRTWQPWVTASVDQAICHQSKFASQFTCRPCMVKYFDPAWGRPSAKDSSSIRRFLSNYLDQQDNRGHELNRFYPYKSPSYRLERSRSSRSCWSFFFRDARYSPHQTLVLHLDCRCSATCTRDAKTNSLCLYIHVFLFFIFLRTMGKNEGYAHHASTKTKCVVRAQLTLLLIVRPESGIRLI